MKKVTQARQNLRRRGTFGAVASMAALALVGCTAGAPDAGGDGELGMQSVNIIVPADPGGGWDQTGRAIAEVATEEGLVTSAPVKNIGGAGGTIGLASLATESDPVTLMLTGFVMVGAVETNSSEVRLEQTTPIARLTEEAGVIVVPASSPYQSLSDLVDDMIKNGKSVSITGGSAGGVDHILAAQLLKEAGQSASQINEKLNYIPNAGGGEAVTLLLGNKVSAGISGISEFAEQVKAGELRALAVSSAEPSELLPDVPTIIDSGYDLVITNWRGVIAPGGISGEDRQKLIDFITEVTSSDSWKQTLETKGWADAFLAGDEFDSYLGENITDVTAVLKDIGLVG
ncbi:putative tricarboxylic transport membrane protein [Rhodoglobus vestalii]|uniref:Putative tricarboxylic transport membrane protein n=1 Tax=Rhodoglobus vestalii TaxID=193384 RepID=A0A8H2K4C3_9MICO|nr:tripartite tricarboxylate transporter substrate-binding protein [Rhodoglobus vestalii]TQO18935.1 putative tricarboxylic transport membrane protein [Rhodoglobus vestalii]